MLSWVGRWYNPLSDSLRGLQLYLRGGFLVTMTSCWVRCSVSFCPLLRFTRGTRYGDTLSCGGSQ